MLILILAVLLAILVIWGNWGSGDSMKNLPKAIKRYIGYVIIFELLYTALVVAIITTSYYNYLSLRTFYDATLEQYKSAVELYTESAVVDVEKAALTDLKYQGYQKEVAGFITSFRDKVVTYNEDFISKKLIKRNFFLGWFIVAPDPDMKVIRLKQVANGKLKGGVEEGA